MDPLFEKPVYQEKTGMVSIPEIIAMKMDIVLRGGRKKTFGICTNF
jgi:hypothetical protein